MGVRKTHDLPAGLKGVQRRFERWRGMRQSRSRIPDALWTAAAKAAQTYGLCRTSRALRLDYYSLKERVEEQRIRAADSAGRAATATLVELVPPPALPAGVHECTLELEDLAGAKMRVHFKGFAAPDLAALSRSFWTPAS